MGLIRQEGDAAGNTYAQAYTRIIRCDIDWSKRRAAVTLATYKDKNARLENRRHVASRTILVKEQAFSAMFERERQVEKASELLAALYEHMMGLPEYVGATAD